MIPLHTKLKLVLAILKGSVIETEIGGVTNYVYCEPNKLTVYYVLNQERKTHTSVYVCSGRVSMFLCALEQLDKLENTAKLVGQNLHIKVLGSTKI